MTRQNTRGWTLMLLVGLALVMSQACTHPSGVRYAPYPAGHPGAAAPQTSSARPHLEERPSPMSDADRYELERFEATITSDPDGVR